MRDGSVLFVEGSGSVDGPGAMVGPRLLRARRGPNGAAIGQMDVYICNNGGQQVVEMLKPEHPICCSAWPSYRHCREAAAKRSSLSDRTGWEVDRTLPHASASVRSGSATRTHRKPGDQEARTEPPAGFHDSENSRGFAASVRRAEAASD